MKSFIFILQGIFLVCPLTLSRLASAGERISLERPARPAMFEIENRRCGSPPGASTQRRGHGLGFTFKNRKFVLTTDTAVHFGPEFCPYIRPFHAPIGVFLSNGESASQLDRYARNDSPLPWAPVKLWASDWGHGMALLEIADYPASFPALVDFYSGIIQAGSESETELSEGEPVFFADAPSPGHVLVPYSSRHRIPLFIAAAEVIGIQVRPEDQGTAIFGKGGGFLGIISGQTLALRPNEAGRALEWDSVLNRSQPVRAQSHFFMIHSSNIYKWLNGIVTAPESALSRHDDRRVVVTQDLKFTLICGNELRGSNSGGDSAPIGGSTDPSGIGGSTDPSGIGGHSQESGISVIGGGQAEVYRAQASCEIEVTRITAEKSSLRAHPAIYQDFYFPDRKNPELRLDLVRAALAKTSSDPWRQKVRIPYFAAVYSDRLLERKFFSDMGEFFRIFFPATFSPIFKDPENRRSVSALAESSLRLKEHLRFLGETAMGLIIASDKLEIVRARVLALCDVAESLNPEAVPAAAAELLLDPQVSQTLGLDWIEAGFFQNDKREKARRLAEEFLMAWLELEKPETKS